MSGAKAYDEEYFHRWYRDPARRVIKPAAVARKVNLVMGIAESLLERPIRSVLDVGCGEAPWRAHLLRARPKLRYVGVNQANTRCGALAHRAGSFRARSERWAHWGSTGRSIWSWSATFCITCRPPN